LATILEWYPGTVFWRWYPERNQLIVNLGPHA
jgi:hypothetical protein